MSWEEMYTEETTCPCGEGRIKQIVYGDDWNRYSNGPVVIECEKCSKRYIVETISNNSGLLSDGSVIVHFLTPKDYPEYSGSSEVKAYGNAANPNWDYTGWLIENFTEDELKNAEEQLHRTKSSANLIGVAAKIRDTHKKALKTVCVGAILASVEEALNLYPEYRGNKLQREELRKKEIIEMTAYRSEKRKHQIRLELRRKSSCQKQLYQKK